MAIDRISQVRRRLAGLAMALLPGIALAGPLQVLVADREGKPVADAVVVLVPLAGGQPKAPLATRVTINQEKMRFIPAVSLVAVGAKATFVNNDPWEHHVRASPAGARNFESASTGGIELRIDGKPEGKPARTAEATFDKAGAVLLGCHLHASMRGHVYVSDSPWALTTGDDGVASFEAVPSGPVNVRVWQADQLIDLPVQQISVTPAPAKASFQLSVTPRRRRV